MGKNLHTIPASDYARPRNPLEKNHLEDDNGHPKMIFEQNFFRVIQHEPWNDFLHETGRPSLSVIL